jgi:TPR repeat protein
MDKASRGTIKKAVRWYRLAADQRDAEAQNNLGMMYADGRGVPQDYREAVKWYRLAADQGNSSRCQSVSSCEHQKSKIFDQVIDEMVRQQRQKTKK